MIYREGNGSRPWRVRLRHDGQDTTRSFPTKRLAEEFYGALLSNRSRQGAGLQIPKETITYNRLCDLYLDQYTAQSKPWFEQMLRYSRDRFGEVEVGNLQSELLGRWLHKDVQLSPKSKSHILRALRQVLQAGVEWGYLDTNPARPRAVQAPSLTANPPTIVPFVSWQEVLLVASKSERWGALIRFACATGLRIEEWTALEWRDVDLENRCVHISRVWRQGKLKGAGKTPGALRTVALATTATSALISLPRPIHGGIVFPADSGEHLNVNSYWRPRVWPKILRAARLEYRPPSQMRHTYATLALAQGCTLEWISRQMGHTTSETTRRFYARFVKKYDDRMLNLLDQMEEECEQKEIFEKF